MKRDRWDKRSVRQLLDRITPAVGGQLAEWRELERPRRPNEHIHVAKKRKKST